MTLDRLCLAVVRAAASTRPRYIHLAFWGVAFAASGASEAGSATPGRGGLMASLYLATLVLHSALAIASAVAFRRYLSRVEFRLVCSAAVVVAVGLSLVAATMRADTGEGSATGPQVLADVFPVAAIAVMLGALAASVLAGRALRRLRAVACEEQLADFAIWLFFWAYLGLGAMLLNPILKRALAIERR